MITNEIKQWLFQQQDVTYAAFNRKLIPNIDGDTIIGVRVPILRAYAKELVHREDIEVFLTNLPHQYYEENLLHSYILSLEKDYERLVPKVEAFLPYIDNWAVSDSFSPKEFKKYPVELFELIEKWIESENPYTIRFGISMLMTYYLDDAFELIYPERVAQIRSEEYYVNMMIAWYFATALAKQYDATITYLHEKKLDRWTHNKTIQKAVESRRITPEQKLYLRSLKY